MKFKDETGKFITKTESDLAYDLKVEREYVKKLKVTINSHNSL